MEILRVPPKANFPQDIGLSIVDGGDFVLIASYVMIPEHQG